MTVLSLQPFIPSGADFAKKAAALCCARLPRELGERRLRGFRARPARFILQDIDMPEVAAQMMVRIDVDDLDAWWAEHQAALSAVKSKAPTEFPWGREVHFIDHAGVCWHVGT